jgi:tetratricopeptide (TPR) repeat protein
MYVTAHAWERALHYYEAALETAGSVKDMLQLAKTYHGLATVYQRMNQPARARQHFEKALALYSIESDLSAVYRVENDVGELLMRLGNLDAAEDHLRKALAGSEELGIDRRGRGYVLANLAELSLKQSEPGRAKEYLAQAQEVGQATGEHIVLANVAMIRGELEERSGSHGTADISFQAAIDLLSRLKMPDRLRDCHIKYAEILEARGSLQAALKHWKAAAKTAPFPDAPSVQAVEDSVG